MCTWYMVSNMMYTRDIVIFKPAKCTHVVCTHYDTYVGRMICLMLMWYIMHTWYEYTHIIRPVCKAEERRHVFFG